jgi:hypothetical protein
MRKFAQETAHRAVRNAAASQFPWHQRGEHLVLRQHIVMVRNENISRIALRCAFGKTRSDDLHERLKVEIGCHDRLLLLASLGHRAPAPSNLNFNM